MPQPKSNYKLQPNQTKHSSSIHTFPATSKHLHKAHKEIQKLLNWLRNINVHRQYLPVVLLNMHTVQTKQTNIVKQNNNKRTKSHQIINYQTQINKQ